MTREEFQKTVSDRFQNTDSGFGNMTQRERILLQIASNEYEKQVKNCSIPDVVGRSEQCCSHYVTNIKNTNCKYCGQPKKERKAI